MAAGTRGGAVDPVKTGGTADGTVIALEREDSFFSLLQLLAKTKFSKQARALEERMPAENPDASVGPINTGHGRNTTWH